MIPAYSFFALTQLCNNARLVAVMKADEQEKLKNSEALKAEKPRTGGGQKPASEHYCSCL